MSLPPHTVIYTHGGGRLGNQIVRFAHWVAWAKCQGGEVEVMNLAFWPFARYFASWQGNPGCIYPLRTSLADTVARAYAALPAWLQRFGDNRSRFPRAAHAVGRWCPGWQAVSSDVVPGEGINLDDPTFVARVAGQGVTTCSGWRIAGWRLFAEREAELRALFQPSPEFARRAGAFLEPLRSKNDVVAGLLIRQSDYRHWAEGRYFFPTPVYVTWIRQLLDLYPGRRVAVVVASEERQDPDLFSGLPCHFASGCVGAGGHWFENFAELALCDFVISAPSTFSAAAAFVGSIPLWPVVAAGQNLALDQVLADGMAGAARHPEFSRSVK